MSFPADRTASCDELILLETPTVADACSGVDLTMEEWVEGGSCENEYAIVRS
ncbi:MAG: hypothetical protein R2795_09445 [Saprospiraceae bacterium]